MSRRWARAARLKGREWRSDHCYRTTVAPTRTCACWNSKSMCRPCPCPGSRPNRSEEHTSELQSLMRISYAVFCLKKKHTHNTTSTSRPQQQDDKPRNKLTRIQN